MNNKSSEAVIMSGFGCNLLIILKAVLFSYVLTIPMFIIIAAILAFTEFPEKLLFPCVIITTVFSSFCGGMITTIKNKDRGWVFGTLTGILYILILYLISGIIYLDFTISRYTVTMIIIGALSGSIGSITGLNAKLKGKKNKYLPRKSRMLNR